MANLVVDSMKQARQDECDDDGPSLSRIAFSIVKRFQGSSPVEAAKRRNDQVPGGSSDRNRSQEGGEGGITLFSAHFPFLSSLLRWRFEMRIVYFVYFVDA